MGPEQVELLKDSREGAICGVRVEALSGSNCHQPVREGGRGEGSGRGSWGTEWVWYGRKTEGCFPEGTVEKVGEFM